MHQVFISYPRDNSSGQQLSRELYSLLKQRQIPVFFDESGIPFGERWLEVLKDAISKSRIMLWVVSEASQDRKWQEREFHEAERLKLRIIPVLAEAVNLPMQVNDQQAAFLFGEQKAEQLDKLLVFLEAESGIDRIKPLIRDALAAKNNESYDKAILKWREVLELEPEHERAIQEIATLDELLDKQLVGHELLAKLAGRIAEINPVFSDVAGVLHGAARHRHADAIIKYTRAFLDGDLESVSYIDVCQSVLHQPQSVPVNNDQTNYTAFTQRVIAGDIVLFIGSELALEYQQASQSESLLAQQLADKAELPEFKGSFSGIAEYYRLNKDYGENLLLEQLRQSLGKAEEPLNLYRLLALIEKPLILISSAYDDALERSFDAVGKPYIELTSLVRRCDDHDIGHLVVRYSDKQEPEVYQPIEEEVSKFRWFEEGRSLIFKIRGTCGSSEAEHEYQREALTLTESDYFTFARYAERMIPAYLAKHFKRKGFLFVGFSPKSWEERLLVNALLARREKAYAKEPAYTVGTAHDQLEAVYWMSQHVQQHDVDIRRLDEYLEEALL